MNHGVVFTHILFIIFALKIFNKRNIYGKKK
jgi:hypothetical protein